MTTTIQSPEAACRALSAHERLSVGFTNEWCSQVLTNVLSYRGRNLPTRDTLVARMASMCRAYPLLRARIPRPEADQPNWVVIPLESFDIVSRIRDKPMEPAGKGEDDQTRAKILDLEMYHGQRDFDIEDGLMWTITRYIPELSDGEDRLGYIAFTSHHALSDGIGAMRLAMLLAGQRDDQLTESDPSLPPTLESTMHLHPSFKTTFQTVFQLRVLPYLPLCIKQYWAKPIPTYWPYSNPPSAQIDRTDTRRCETRHLVMTIPAALVSELKRVGRENGVQTLHPLLCLAWVAACYSVNGQYTSGDSALHLTLCSPFSVRNEALGHPFTTGNYQGEIDCSWTLTGTESFWHLARNFALDIQDPDNKRDGTEFWALEKWLPVGQKTGKEAAFASHSPPEYAIGNSVSVSNVGLMDTSDILGLQGHVWVQNRSPFGSGLFLNIAGASIAGAQPEISVSWGFKVGGTANGSLGYDNVERMTEAYIRILQKVANADSRDCGVLLSGLTG